ncbi:MAG: hypothetical protein RBG13Loki_3397 [Promethearchaeota archaeon CR_4]|nr:MAG: hypothetical protein RBG13Loki_3397 [Candidatus Lokiarchaeota archaeon CR_4]
MNLNLNMNKKYTVLEDCLPVPIRFLESSGE